MEEPNQDISIFSGDFQLKLKETIISVKGKIFFSWFPSAGVKVSGTVTSGSIHALPLDEALEIIIDGFPVGNCQLKDLLHCFNHFLYLGNGRRTSLYFITGKHEREEKWSAYNLPRS